MDQHYKFMTPPLPYPYDALEPYIDKKTMELHHDKHLQTYVDNLNKALSKYPLYQNWTLVQLLVNVSSLPKDIQTDVIHNGGGVFNHEFFFANMTNQASPEPVGALAAGIDQTFSGYQCFHDQFKTAALSVFGSGYAWLVVDAAGMLQIITTKNQDTPLPMGLYPVLNLDVWEHAYYLKHYNIRADYIEDWFHIINWQMADQNYCNFFQ